MRSEVWLLELNGSPPGKMNKEARCAELCGQSSARGPRPYLRQGECGLRRGVANSEPSSGSENGFGSFRPDKCRNPLQSCSPRPFRLAAQEAGVWLLELNGSPPGSPVTRRLFLSLSLSWCNFGVVSLRIPAVFFSVVGLYFWLKASARASPVGGESHLGAGRQLRSRPVRGGSPIAGAARQLFFFFFFFFNETTNKRLLIDFILIHSSV